MILSEKDLQLLNSLPMSEMDADRKESDLKIEFDGTTVLCRVCGDKASGFHYGVHSCEGCKGFFRRSIQQKIQYRPCTKNQQCSILRMNRNRCQYCRLKKCIAVGMSRDAVRFGRVPKREKAKILAAMQKVNASSQEKALTAELEDEHKLLSTIIRAHEETCDYTHDKVAPLLERARTQPVFTHCPPQLACPLNPVPHSLENGGSSRMLEDFSERFSPAIRGVVDFAKTIPGFSLLAQDDQVTLLKAGVFEVLLVRLACMFDSQTNSMICLNGQVLRRESLHSASNARFLLDSMFDFADRLNALKLQDSEIGLFCAVVVIAADRPGLRNTDLVQKIQKKLMNVLQRTVTAHHPENPAIFDELMKKIPDLRTLNTLHSEKLLAYKMEPKDQQNAVANEERSQVTVATSTPNGMPPGHYLGPVIPDQWYQFAAAVATSHRPLGGDDDNRSTSSPGQQSQLSGSSAASVEWGNSSDSKDGHEPFGSPRSVASSGISVEDSTAKSPLRSSSAKSYESEGYCTAEMVPFQQVACEKRPRELMPPTATDHGCSSGDEAYMTESPVKVTVTVSSPGTCPMKFRRIDSPTDSGVESGKEHGTNSTPTASVCSSPRSSLEEKVKDVVSDSEASDKPESIDDMPVLKRALQAPPLINTNMLMDEAYRHHKKFRAARKDSSDSGPVSPPVSVTAVTSGVGGVSLASSHSTLVKTLEQAPRYMSEQQLKRTDLIHNIIMQTETVPSPGPQSAGWSQGPPPPSSGNVRIVPSQTSVVTSQYSTPVSVPASGNSNFVHSVPQTTVNAGPTTYVHASSSNSGSQATTKNVIVCPPGYYIPTQGVALATYSNSPSTSWHFMAPQQSAGPNTATTVTVATSPMQGTRTQSFISTGHPQPQPSSAPPSSATLTVNPQQQQHLAPPPVSAPVMSVSPQPVVSGHHRVAVYDPRSPASRATSPLVIRTPPPVHGVPHLSPNLPVSELQTDATDTQPLNLSKRDTSSQPSTVKVES